MSNYFIGNDPDRWLREVPCFGKLVVSNAYPGVDIEYGARDGLLEYRLRVGEGGDLSAVKLVLDGVEDLHVTERGELSMKTPWGESRQSAPRAWVLNSGNGQSTNIPVNFEASGASITLRGGASVGWPLVVDPAISFGTFFGGSDNDWLVDVAAKASGELVLAGWTSSTDFPTVNAVQPTDPGLLADGFVAEIDAARTQIVFSTYLGGTGGDRLDDLDLGPGGTITVSGQTYSDDFPVVNPIQSSRAGIGDVFITRFAPSGAALLFSSYFGGSDIDSGLVSVQSNGNVVIAGQTSSTDLPLQAALWANPCCAFIARIDMAGPALAFSTYVPGLALNALALDVQDNIFVAGDTWNDALPVKDAYQPIRAGMSDVALIEINGSGTAQIFGTFLGGTEADGMLGGITVDGSGRIAIAGITYSTDFPVTGSLQPQLVDPGYGDPFVALLSPGAAEVTFATYLGGLGLDAFGVPAFDSSGRLLVGGLVEAATFPLASPIQDYNAGGYDAYIAAIDPVARRLDFASYLGGSGSEGLSLREDPLGGYLAWGGTASPDFPLPNPLFPKGFYEDAVVVSIRGPWAGFSGAPLSGVAPLTVQFVDDSTGAITAHQWAFGDGSTSTLASPSHVYTAPGTYDVSLVVTDPTGSGREEKLGYVLVKEVDADFTASQRAGSAPLPVQFTSLASGPVQAHDWSFGDGGTSTAVNPAHTYATPGTYTVTLTVTGPSGSDVEVKTDFILATLVQPTKILVGPGPHPTAPPRALGLDAVGAPTGLAIDAYGTPAYGVNVGAGDLDASGNDDVLTGPGPGPPFGPHVRAFQAVGGAPFTKISFYAYGTLRYGVNVAGFHASTSAYAEILTGAGPGAVFGPHVRGWRYAGGPLAPLPGASYFAYGTLKWGVNVGHGNLLGDGREEILTMPGPSVSFAPQARAWSLGPPLAQKANFVAFPAPASYGGRIDAADVDGDGWDEILAGRGPGPSHTTTVLGFDVDDGPPVAIPGAIIVAMANPRYGAEPHGADVDGDGLPEVLVGLGPDPGWPGRLRAFEIDATPISTLDVVPYGTTHGVHAIGASF